MPREICQLRGLIACPTRQYHTAYLLPTGYYCAPGMRNYDADSALQARPGLGRRTGWGRRTDPEWNGISHVLIPDIEHCAISHELAPSAGPSAVPSPLSFDQGEVNSPAESSHG